MKVPAPTEGALVGDREKKAKEKRDTTVSRLRPELRGGLLALAAAVLWSTGGVCVKALNGYGPVAISSGRSVITALFFLVLLRGRIVIPRTNRGWIAAGVVVYAAVVMSYVVATRFTTAANAILLQYTAPLWIAVLGWAVLRERPSMRDLLAMVLGGTGVVFCASEGLTLFMKNRSISTHLLGDMIALGSGLCFALTTVILRIMSKEKETAGPPLESASGSQTTSPPSDPSASPSSSRPDEPSASLVCLFYGNVLAALIGLPALIHQIPNAGVASHSYWIGLGVLLWLGGGQLGAGYWCFQRGLRTTRALTASLIGLVEPVLNPVWVALVVHEIPSKGTRIGGVLVLASVVLTLTGRRGGR